MSDVVALLVAATGAVHLSAGSSDEELAQQLDATGRVIIETPSQPDEGALLAIRLMNAATPGEGQDDDTATNVFIPIDGLMAEQVVAILKPVLVGPRLTDKLDQHVARRLSLLSLAGLPVPGHEITELITGHLERDSADADLLNRWWRSTVVDENTLQSVLEPEMFAWVDQFDAPSAEHTWPVSHAGLLHTYGYTLSTAWTPYGWKSDRYTDGTLAAFFGIDLDDLTPWAAEGTILSNLTHALDGLLASGRPHHLIEESGRLVKLDGGSADGILRTRIYEPAGGLDEQLLVYTVEFAGTGVERYITAFPMGDGGVQALLADQEPRSRFNVAATLVDGSRIVRTR